MTNRELKNVARQLAQRAKKWPYDFWVKLDYPIDFQMVVRGEELGIEIVLGAISKNSIKFAILVDDGWPPSVIMPPLVNVEIANELALALPETTIDCEGSSV